MWIKVKAPDWHIFKKDVDVIIDNEDFRVCWNCFYMCRDHFSRKTGKYYCRLFREYIFLEGEKYYKKIKRCQKCIDATDLESVFK